MKRNAIHILISIFLLSSCSSTEAVMEEGYTSEVLLIQRVGKGKLYGAGEEGINEGLIIIKNEADWQELKSKMDITNPVSQNLKAVDFSSQIVMAYFDTTRPNGGYDVKITQAIDTGNEVEVQINLIHSGLPATSVIIQPFHIVAMPMMSKPITFKTNQITE